MTPPEVLVIGAASVDIKARARGPLQRDTSNPSSIRFSLGGVARNIAENLARLGVHATLLSAVGTDHFGQRILEHTLAGGVDMSWANSIPPGGPCGLPRARDAGLV